MIFAHAFIGLIIAWFIISQEKRTKKRISPFGEVLIWISAAVGAVFPDFDLLYVFFLDSSVSHRSLITHSIIPYAIIYIGGMVILKLINSKRINFVVFTTFILGIVSHLVSDIFVGPVYIFKPLINKAFIWTPFVTVDKDGFLGYVFSPYMIVELAIILIGTILLIKGLGNHKKEFRFILYLLATIQLGVWIALFPFIYRFN